MNDDQNTNDDLGHTLQRGGVVGSTESLYDMEGLLEQLGCEFERQGKNLRITCPTPEHPDNHPSASIDVHTGLWHCFACKAGGDAKGFLSLFGVQETKPLLTRYAVDGTRSRRPGRGTRRADGAVVRGWAPNLPEDWNPSPSPVGTDYIYTDADGNGVLLVSLWHDKGKRRFTQRRWKEDAELPGGGLWTRGRPSGRMPLYHLPEVVAAVAAGEPVWLVEGEKDTDALRERGVTATTASEGAGNWTGENGTDLLPLAGAEVIVVADRDHGPGLRHAMELAEALEEAGSRVRIVGAAVGKDAADHLHNGFDLEEFVPWLGGFGIHDREEVVSHPESRIPSALPEGLVIDFRSVSVERDEWLPGLEGLVLKGEFTMLAGDGGAGKSTTAAGWIAALSRKGVTVLYLAERSLKATRKKLQAAGADFDQVLTFDMRQFTDVRQGISYIEAAMRERGVQLLILDPLNHFLPAGTDGHKDSSFSQAIRNLLDLSAMEGLTVLGLHHLNKDDKADPIRRLMGGAGYVNKPGHVLGLGPHPADPTKRALTIIKTNADDGLLEGALIFERRTVQINIDGYTFTVATSIEAGRDPDCAAEDVLRPQKRDSGTTRAAEDEFLEARWVPTNSDSAQDEDWYAQQLEAEADIRLDPKNVGKLLTSLYEQGFNYLPAKSGKGGHKRRFWRKPLDTPPVAMSEDELTNLDDDIDELLGND